MTAVLACDNRVLLRVRDTGIDGIGFDGTRS